MRKFPVLVVAGLLACEFLLRQSASPLWGQQKSEPGASETSAAQKQEKELNLRYAQAYLAFMEATLARYEESNRNAPNTIRPTIIQGIQDSVRKARERVQMAQSDEVGESQIYVSSAEADLRLAQESLRRAEAANSRNARPFSDGEIARLKSQVELAKVRVEKARHLASESPLSNVRYEIELLREDVQELQLVVALIRRN
jgi:hypothetical protein